VLCALQEFRRRSDLMMCRRGVREELVGFYEDVWHGFLLVPGVCRAHVAGRDGGEDVLS